MPCTLTRLRQSATEFTDRFQLMIERKSNLGTDDAAVLDGQSVACGQPEVSGRLATDSSSRRRLSLRQDKPAVGPLSLEMQRGEIVGIAGASGSGKSTLIKLLLGLYHLDRGTLRIGDVPVDEIQHEELVSNIAVVLQETELFNFSLRENITMMRDVPPSCFSAAARSHVWTT